MRRRGPSVRWALAFALGLALVWACAPRAEGPPRLVLDESACARCSMLISEPAFAAAYRLDDRERLFDDLGCLLATLADEPDAARARIWVGDFESGLWLSAEEAVFVRSASLHSPMGGGLAAVRDRAAARSLAARLDGSVVASLEVLVREGADAG